MDTVSHGASNNKVWCWYSIHVWTGHDGKVATFLMSKNFEVFLPRVQRVVIRPDGAKTIRWHPIIDGYLFVRCDDDELARLKTQKIPHVYGVLWQECVSEADINRYKVMVGGGAQNTVTAAVTPVSFIHR